MLSPTGMKATMITIVLALLAMFPPLATDMYLSAMEPLAEAMNTSSAGAELSLSLFFLGLCVGQLIVGPMIDVAGRKGPLLIGVAVFTLASIGLLLTDNIVVFNTLRFVQALGACAGMVVGRAVVTDLYEGRRAAQVMTVLVMLMTLGPILAPFLGSLLLTLLGWRSIFVALVLVGLFALVLTQVVIPETLPADKRNKAAIGGTLRRLAGLCRTPAFILPALVTACVQASIFAFITGSSGVFQGAFGLSSQAYGLLFGLIASAMVIFGQINTWLLNRYEPEQIVARGLPLFVLTAALLLGVSGTSVLWVLVVPLWLSLGLVGLLSANVMSIAMAGAAGAAGLGSAGIGALQFGLAFATSTLVALAGTGSAGPMATAILVSASAGWGGWLVFRRLCGVVSPAQ
ncbi:Bcr/CflA family efflux MFS transporter [Citreicella sp. C3M06]|uniref:Bcr/CflA family efflux MFS transporter n=1 Tax=Citreicella sp. C3M06 TaxID=2841564 RepID=UPI001C09D4FA|nr:Bcr/CflA family efflux MFS transporter [Citreicella sp. C3M06]MBU2962228.1 Bcr/CflA family efflux MFS transporter [Citreicella sp. C3M06]